jgi:hypothetical protein
LPKSYIAGGGATLTPASMGIEVDAAVTGVVNAFKVFTSGGSFNGSGTITVWTIR